MPFAWCKVIHLDLTERDIEHQEDVDGEHHYQLWPDEITERGQYFNMCEEQIYQTSENDGT